MLCTIIKNGRTDPYGIPLVADTVRDLPEDYVRDLVTSGFATTTEDLSGDGIGFGIQRVLRVRNSDIPSLPAPRQDTMWAMSSDDPAERVFIVTTRSNELPDAGSPTDKILAIREVAGVPTVFEQARSDLLAPVTLTTPQASAVNQLVSEIAGGSKLVQAKTTAAHFVFGAYATIIDEMRKLCPGFGSSARDAVVGGNVSTSAQMWYDPVNGNDANNGSTLALAKRTIPAPFYVANNTKYFIPSGSTISLNGSTTWIQSDKLNVIITVWDSLIGSPTYGQEITWQPDPFMRALFGGWVTDSEKSRLYYTIEGNVTSTTGNIRGVAVANASSPTKNVIRGAVIRGFGYCAATAGANMTLRLEDCVIDGIGRTPGVDNGRTGGDGIRVESTTGKMECARLFVSGVGVDCFWVLADSTGNSVTDFAVYHTCDRQAFGSQHADVFQFAGGYPGDFTIRRGVIRLRVQPGNLSDSGNGELNSSGAVLMSSNGGATVRSGGLMEDVVFVSNHHGVHMNDQGGMTYRRVVGLLEGQTSNAPHGNVVYHGAGSNTEDACVWATLGVSGLQLRGIDVDAHVNKATTLDLGRLDA